MEDLNCQLIEEMLLSGCRFCLSNDFDELQLVIGMDMEGFVIVQNINENSLEYGDLNAWDDSDLIGFKLELIELTVINENGEEV